MSRTYLRLFFAVRAESELLYPPGEMRAGIFYQERSHPADANRAYLF